MGVLHCAPRALYTKLLLLGSLFTLVILVYTISSSNLTLSSIRNHSWTTPPWSKSTKARPNATSCTPTAYASGSWRYHPRTNATALVHPEDAVGMAGFEGCASSREFYWHLGSDNGEMWDRFPVVSSWRWGWGDDDDHEGSEGEGGCVEEEEEEGGGEYGFRRLYDEKNKRQFVRDLVQNGGWLLIGDSITEGHFFSISCLLYPHVLATPDYVQNPYFDRAWPQHMYLNPSSPLVPTLQYPPGFNISTTPLITFRRVDLLLSTSELEILHREKHPDAYEEDGNFTLFSDEAVWSLSPTTYIEDLFLLPLPYGNYANLIVSTAGHWTTSMFSGYASIDGLISFFAEAMHAWATHTQLALTLSHDSDSGGVLLPNGQRRNRNVLVRAYLPGHENCHTHRTPAAQIPPMKWGWYNWGSIPEFNRVFEDILANHSYPTTPSSFPTTPPYPNIHYLPIDRPARLRPDAHATGDCLHIIAGAGVLEGWTEYVWHYTTWFLRGGEVE